MTMRHTFFALLLVTAVALAIAPIGATAQDASINTTVEDATNATDELPDFPGEWERGDQQVDGDIQIKAYDYHDETFYLRLENTGDRPKTVTVTEAVQFSKGTGRMSIQRERLLPGETTVTIGVEPRGGEAAVTLTTDDSISNGYGTYVSTGTSNGIFNGSASWGLVWAGSGFAFIGSAFGVREYKRRKHTKPEKRVEEP
jgi:hypothetical protein